MNLSVASEAADEITQLRDENKRLRDAVQDVLNFARGGDYGEIICNVEDFAALEKLIEEIEREVDDG
jgi:hypothetical protein